MSLNHSRSTLISHTDRSVLRRFKSNEPNGSPNSFKTWIKKWNAAVYCSETNSSAVFIFTLAKLSKTDSIVSKITVLNAYLLNCCIKSVSHLHSCSTRVILHLLLVWYCLTITYDVNMRQKLKQAHFLPHFLSFRDILTTFYRLHRAVSCCPPSYLSSINWNVSWPGKRLKCVNNFNALFFTHIINLINALNGQP